MNVIIVDDEPKAIALLTSYLSHFNKFEVVATFRNGLKALKFLNENTVDVAFLDINMPHLNGLSLSRMISSNTSIVFTTAYSEHALESYDVNAMDYLLKPISLERFSKTMNKLINQFEHLNKKASEETNAKKVFIKSGLEAHQIEVTDINYLRKDGNYMYYFIGNKKIMARESISESLEVLNENFIQIQKSFIINIQKIESISKNHVIIKGIEIPIGLQYKKQLLDKINL